MLVRAALDGVAAGLAYAIEVLAALGIAAPEVTLVGGGSQHDAWRQAIADATGLPVVVRGGAEHAARGAALQAMAIARGESIDTMVARHRPEVVARIEPRPEQRAAFRLEERQRLIAELKRAAAADREASASRDAEISVPTCDLPEPSLAAPGEPAV
jgi:xylulokinase